MIELLNIDCMEYMATCKDKQFDLAIVDPPYGIGVNHNMGRREGDKPSNYKPAVWDNKSPDKSYFIELERISKNRIIWGANHFISKIPYDSSCWIMWDKKFSDEVTFSQFELAWTSFNTTCKKFDMFPTGDDRIHPTQKPVQLYKWLLRTFATPDMKIIDTHLGSGSSAIAAYDFGCDFVGCEIDKEYYESAKHRFETYKLQTKLCFT